ncbi:hypothetical protein GCM10011371_07830 [Novosphingobium marinum]|uniref:Uncharacterized protein n=1 Tax=Novosphingobium marinum TaxID=1514948 RepID=A0A7Y9XWP5_9SPHN|nr:hypothetical protein [Novosphingobium marinum]NYH94471.1 hypothetical protein [Novosphingobium marinum]GGC22567.1 hypothetical protein GCM10011371_07830 [Novosphingobium marinum]
MDAQRAERALARIAAAADRLERAANAPALPDDELARRHEALKGSVADALRRLDALLPDGER